MNNNSKGVEEIVKHNKLTSIDIQHANLMFIQLSGYLYTTPIQVGRSVLFLTDGSEDVNVLEKIKVENMAYSDEISDEDIELLTKMF